MVHSLRRVSDGKSKRAAGPSVARRERRRPNRAVRGPLGWPAPPALQSPRDPQERGFAGAVRSVFVADWACPSTALERSDANLSKEMLGHHALSAMNTAGQRWRNRAPGDCGDPQRSGGGGQAPKVPGDAAQDPRLLGPRGGGGAEVHVIGIERGGDGGAGGGAGIPRRGSRELTGERWQAHTPGTGCRIQSHRQGCLPASRWPPAPRVPPPPVRKREPSTPPGRSPGPVVRSPARRRTAASGLALEREVRSRPSLASTLRLAAGPRRLAGWSLGAPSRPRFP
eukprot:gene13583-biopygen3523